MAGELHDAIIRRSDGSIDIEFYARRSARLRREAIAATPGILRGWFARIFARLGTGLRKLGQAGPGRDITVR